MVITELVVAVCIGLTDDSKLSDGDTLALELIEYSEVTDAETVIAPVELTVTV